MEVKKEYQTLWVQCHDPKKKETRGWGQRLCVSASRRSSQWLKNRPVWEEDKEKRWTWNSWGWCVQLNEWTLSVRNADRQVGTPEDLSCFTPSPIASSPNTPSPVPLHFRSPNLSRSSIVPPSERIIFVPSPPLLFPEAPDHEVDRIFFTSITLLEVSASGSWVPLTLNDVIKAVTCQRMERFESDFSHYPVLHSILTRLLSGFIERIRERMTFSRLRRSDIEDPLKKKPGQENGNLSDYIIQLKPAPTGFRTKKFLRRLRINFVITSSDARGGVNGFEISFTASGHQIVIEFSGLIIEDLEQMHNSRVRRSESCESIRSLDSFLTDPVVDWKELLYGYNLEAPGKEREFWIPQAR